MIDKPWIPDLALLYLNTIIKPNMKIFEYGSGGSTIYFSEKSGYVISVEHDEEWYQKVPVLSNVEYHLIKPALNPIGNDKANPDYYTSNSLLLNFKEYVSLIDRYDLFDIIFIDGRSRASCLVHASKKVKVGGWVILDNVERDYYLENTRHLFEKWETAEFFGYGPYIDWPWRTLFMKKTKGAL